MRSDAQDNYDRILSAAVQVFARDGYDASLRSIADEAGVGIATLYRRFPTREALVETVHRSRVDDVCDSAAALADSGLDAVTALRTWMVRFTVLLITKHGMAEALRPILTQDADFRAHSRKRLTEAADTLLEAGVRSGALRDDVDGIDLVRGLSGIAFVSQDSDHAAPLLDLLIDGLRRRPASR